MRAIPSRRVRGSRLLYADGEKLHDCHWPPKPGSLGHEAGLNNRPRLCFHPVASLDQSSAGQTQKEQKTKQEPASSSRTRMLAGSFGVIRMRRILAQSGLTRKA